MKQTATPCAFTSSDSWVILSPIEQSIKRKIEAVGTPLKDWNIQINYGIKTGCNEAFIIDEAKRSEILANCHDSAERKRTEQIIRPDFDSRNYGYSQLSKLLRAIERFEIGGAGAHVWVKDKGAVQ